MSNQTPKKAVALYYDGENAPHITARGTGAIAQEIIALAQAHEVPLCDNSTLVDLLVQLELGEAIPQELYRAVACVIAFAYELEGKSPKDKDSVN